MSDELRNRSQKKKDVWLRLHNVGKQSCTTDLKLEYQRLRKFTKKACNAWWSARAADSERRAWAAEQSGHGGSLIKELRLLRSHCSKPSATSLSAKGGSNLTRDVDKLHPWAEHFAEFVNCVVNVNEATLEALPVIIPCPENGSNAPNNEELCGNLSEEDIAVANSQLRNGRAPGLDEVSGECLSWGKRNLLVG